MFNLNTAIAAWRRTLEHQHVFRRTDLDELEAHVCDHVEGLIKEGWSEEEAFRRAMLEVGDFGTTEQEYTKIYARKTRHAHGLGTYLGIQIAMFTNYVKIAWRNLLRHKGYTSINIAGLAVGVACCVFILLYVHDELRYDRFHEHAADTYRLVDGMRFGEAFSPSAITPSGWSEELAATFPEVVAATRFKSASRSSPLIRYQDQQFYERRIIEADSNFFEVFTYAWAQGNPQIALANPYSVVITEATAQKYFGAANPLGEVLELVNGRGRSIEHEVTGVLKNMPTATSFPFDFVFPARNTDPNREWTHTFVQLEAGYDPEAFEPKLATFLQERYGDAPYAPRQTLAPILQPLASIHLHSNLQFEYQPNSDVAYVYMLLAIALFIIGIASINYMNLATARSAHRAREVGVRKAMGAHRKQVVQQFLGESVLITFLALVVAALLIVVFIASFNTLAGKTLVLAEIPVGFWVIGGLIVTVGLGLGGGIYPAFFLSSFDPVRVLKGSGGTGQRQAEQLRKGLVVVQFAVTLVMLIGTAVVYDQLHYLQNKRLGFDTEQIVAVTARSPSVKQQGDAFKAALATHPNVLSASFAQVLPGKREQMASMVYQFENESETNIVRTFAVDHDFIETMGMVVVGGRAFSRAFGSDSSAFILNQAAVDFLGWDEPLGRRVQEVNMGWDGRVVGVVQDFHFTSLQHTIEPAVIHVLPPMWYNELAVRIRPENIAETLAHLEATWKQFAPDQPFAYTFLNASFDALYQNEERLGRVFGAFAGLALLVACLGLFALASFMAERRVKEIGVRKVLGASATQVVGLLSKDFIKLVCLAIAIGLPLAYVVMHQWLNAFAYRTDISPTLFVLASVGALLVALLTVSYQALKAAFLNPAQALRHE